MLGATDPFSLNGNQFSLSNILVTDAALELGTTLHHHDNVSSSTENPSVAPTLIQSNTGGTLPSGTIIYYEYVYQNSLGLQTTASPVGNITTPSPITTPGAPTAVPTTGTGTLIAGTYLYKVSAYVGINTQETLAGPQVSVLLTLTGENTLTMPTLPAGATGFNIYRQSPSDSQFLYLTSITGPTLVDNGLAENCNRGTASGNATNSQNEVTVTIVAPPAGWTANIYRTYTSGSWGGSEIASGITGTSFVDTGAQAGQQTPPSQSQIPSSPTKVLLTGGAEVQGLLPMANLAGFPFVVTFSFPGGLAVEQGVSTWVCEFTSATIVSVRASLGKGYTPAVQPVIVDVLKGSALSGNPPTYASIFSSATPVYPEVLVGKEIGTPQAPVVTALLKGDNLVTNILQTGGGATPTDGYLTVNIYLTVIP